MSRILKLFIATILVVTLLRGISVGIAQQQRTVTLSILINALEVPVWQEVLVKEFETEYPDIKINLIEAPNDTNLQEDLYTSAFLLGDSPYDLIMMDVVWVPKFAAAGWLLDLTDRINASDLSAFLEKDVEASIYEGKLYRIPFQSDVGMLYYRQDLLAAAKLNPPETFSNLIDISQALQGNGAATWGYVWQGKQYEGLAAMFTEVLAGFGGFWVDPETLAVGLDKPEAIAAIKFLISTIDRGVSPPGVTTYAEEETRRLFQNGETLFLRNWPYVWSLANQNTSPIAGLIAIKPMVSAPEKQGGACLGGWGLGISKTSKYPEAAWQAIEYFTSTAAQRQFILKTGYVPSRRPLFTDPEIIAKYPHYPQLLEVVENAVLRPQIPQYAQASDILQRYLSGALTGRFDPVKAMKSAADETRRLLGTS
ncbi:MAG: ABC transporter substrate-binding protein [Hormoscilla sp. SP5CHS1]|nr:ABC transporter substrate-binding protein [Hormoscilla sp. SP12CHS1]MBC6452179.1 ABC transporter substrate-binding protein [Hormoscilla sp. SP5CHS1]